MQIAQMIAVGLVTGVFSGIFGVGGGVILVPILVLVFKYKQQTANATSLVALLLPVGLLGVIEYYKTGNLSVEQVRLGLLVAVGLFFGTYLGAKIGALLPGPTLQKAFAVLMFVIAAKVWFSSSS